MNDPYISPPDDSVRINDLKVKCYLIPTDAPESDGTFEWDKTVLVTVRLNAGGAWGFGYTYGDLSTSDFIMHHLHPVVTGKNVFHHGSIWDEMRMACRNLGIPGVASMAVSAVDIALWDLRGKLLKLPVFILAGMHRDKIAAYGSGGFTSYSDEQLAGQFGNWLDEGFSMFKMKIGRNKEKDESRIKFARHIIGDNNLLFIDANGAYHAREACSYAHRFEKFRISWFEEPVSSDDLTGLAFVRSNVHPEISIAAGEYGYDILYFRRMLEAGAIDILQADATRCGGITGFLKAGILCEAFNVPLSAHTAPTVHMHACCSASKSVHLEYFHDHARIEEMLFDGFIRPSGGFMAPEPARPGLGIEFREKDAEKFLFANQ
jgi:L-alanine-DL-glutamate epimerase-like enolase superfamily enzyme